MFTLSNPKPPPPHLISKRAWYPMFTLSNLKGFCWGAGLTILLEPCYFSEKTEDSQNEETHEETQYVTSVWGSDDDLSGLTSMREEPQGTSTPYQRPTELKDLSSPHQFIPSPGT